MSKLRYDRRNEEMVLDGYGRITSDSGTTDVPLELVKDMSLTALATEMRKKLAKHRDLDESLQRDIREILNWSLEDPGHFEPDESLLMPARFEVNPLGDCFLVVELSNEVDGDWEAEWPELIQVLNTWASRHGVCLVELKAEDYGRQFFWVVTLQIRTRGRTISYLAELSGEIQGIANACAYGPNTIESKVTLLRAGYASALLGFSESQDLEAKRTAELDSMHGQLELAKDVASFCNTTKGGLIIIGIGTKTRSGHDELHKIHPISNTLSVRRIRKLLDTRIFPPVEGLEIEICKLMPTQMHKAVTAGGVMYIRVPPQSPEMKPFVVQGVVVDRQIMANYICVPERRGEDTIFRSIAALHSSLVAGRAYLLASSTLDKF